MRLLFLLLITVFSFEYCFSQNNKDYCDLFQKAINIYNENSLNPIELNKFDVEQFQNELLLSVDPYSIIFTSNDLELFNDLNHSIQNDINSSYCAIENNLNETYKNNIENTIEIFEKFKTYEFDFNKKDSINIGFDSLKDSFELDKESRCKLYIKSLIIQDVLESTIKYDSLKNKTVLHTYIDSIKTKRISYEIELLKKILDNPLEYQEKLFCSFIKSIIIQYDPYAYLFSNETYNKFKEQLSTYSSYFGFQLETNNQGEIIIASLIPGSFAWKTGAINTGDKVLKLETENNASINIKESELIEIMDFLSSVSTEKLTITLLKSDNKTKRIDLYREKLVNIENSVQAYILHGEKKVGYIILPAFYTSWDTQEQFGCAQDVGRAIYYLKKENIESLIIDLRNNSGGSIREAIDLAGIFVDYGTLSVAQNKNNELLSIKDFNRGTLYSEPMALLVNSNSASASEMVAAVLQDYNRAIIIGDTTFGKATGQILLPLDEENEEVIKFTTNKYYRVTGKTYNVNGVIPDIFLPDYISKTNHNKAYHNSNIVDLITKKTYYKPLTSIPIDSLKKKSMSRIISNAKFQKLSTIYSIYSNLFFQNKYLPLDFDSYYKVIQQKEFLDNQVDSFMILESNYFTIDLLPKDKEMLQINSYYSDLYESSIRRILADPYIEETLKILNDYTNIKKN